nr:MAG TPA: hypothetical protein [Bacteriophage sp.]
MYDIVCKIKTIYHSKKELTKKFHLHSQFEK